MASTALASLAILISYLGADGETVFGLVLMTGTTAAIPYTFSAAAQIKWRVADKRVGDPRFARDMIVAVLSLGVLAALHLVLARNTSEAHGCTGRRT